MEYYNSGGSQDANCDVNTIVASGPTYLDSSKVIYNEKGLPVNIVYYYADLEFEYSNVYTFVYTYDDQDRLISETSDWVYSQEQVYYAYEGNSKLPVRDTIPMIFGRVVVDDLEYDQVGRIVHISRRTIDQWPDDTTAYATEETSYYYDLRGNRQESISNPGYSGLIEYSEKPSLYTLNSVWNIVYKNWSKNSPLYGEEYNDKNLPTRMKAEYTGYFQPFLTLSKNASVTYNCE